MSRSTRSRSAESSGAPEPCAWVRLRHPAFASGPRRGAGTVPQEMAYRSPLNLKREDEILYFALGLFSALAFLEREGWPFRPAPENWVLDGDGLPCLLRPPGEPASDATGSEHAALIFRFLAGKPAPASGPWPTLPRRHKNFARWNAWLSAARGRTGRDGSSLHDLLSGLWDFRAHGIFCHELPSAWGAGAVWEAPFQAWPKGYSELKGKGQRVLEGALAHACDSSNEPPLSAVFLGNPPPYPFAALEPLMAALLGGTGAARSWIGARLAGGIQALSDELSKLLEANPGAGWILWPGLALDAESRRVLMGAGLSLQKPLVALSEGPEAGAGRLSRVHLLWLPGTAERWYVEHAEAFFGPGTEDLLIALDGLPAGEPRSGSALVPPTPKSLSVPRRNRLGRPSKADPLTAVLPKAESPEVLARRGDLAQLLLDSRRLRGKGAEAEGLFWEGTVLLLIGQASLALALWGECGPDPKHPGRLDVYRARAYEKLQDYGRALKSLRNAEAQSVSGRDRELGLLLKGQLLWVSGRTKEAEAILSDLACASADPDVRSQAVCHVATLALHCGRVEEALRLLEEARSLAPEDPEPLTRFLLLHRLGVAYRKMGEFARALEAFQAALDLAARFGFRLYEAGCQSDCGNALRRLSRFEEAVACFTRCDEGAQALGLDNLHDSARFNLAVCRLEGGEPLAAKTVFEEAVAAEKSAGNPLYAAYDHYWLAVACQQLGDYPAALDWAEKGLLLLEGVKDPEVGPSLLTLRGEILLLTGQNRKLGFLLKELQATLTPRHEAFDRLAFLALRCSAAKAGIGAFTSLDRKAAEDLLPACSSRDRAFWFLLSAQEEAHLVSAWEEARSARNAYLACRTLLALAERRALPPLAPEERRWLAGYLERNRIRGPERDLLPLLIEPLQPLATPAPGLAEPLALLAAAGSHPEETEEGILILTGAKAGCLLRPGHPSRFWGDSLPEERRSLLEAAGMKGELPARGGMVLALPGRDGLWCGLFKPGRRSFDANASTLASLWAKLLPAVPTDLPAPPPVAHPALGRYILTRSPAMAPVLESLQRAAAFHFPVLLTGEPGVGKEACACALHAASDRGSKRWVPANCANLTPTLAASLLFGHRRGSFTGADRDQTGLVEAARGTTLFLDEVGELPLEVQAHLLRFLQDGSFLPLGEVRPRESDARIVAATNRDLEGAAVEGRFREDLFHRLNVIRVEIPPLRARPEDIPFLFEHFLAQAFSSERLEAPSVDPAVQARLAVYPWPGNVRELQNVAKAAMVAAHPGRDVRERHLPARLLRPAIFKEGQGRLDARLREAERRIIEEAVREAGGNFSAASRALGLSRQGLFAKMKRLGMK